jgi:hypothetical protein
MIPVGYMAKRVSARPEWLKAERVVDVHSVSNCISHDFADYVSYWQHNGYWFFDSPTVIRRLAREHSLDLAGTSLFYYEVHELEFNDGERRWTSFEPDSAFATHVVLPHIKILEGYDVATFSARTRPECSPPSCNSLATEVVCNEHCLLASLEQARELLDHGRFADTEPGPYRIFAVYATMWP